MKGFAQKSSVKETFIKILNKNSTMTNPVTYLTKQMWKYSKGNRHNVILYTCMFVVAGFIYFLEPLVVAKLLNIIQEQGVHSGNILNLLGIVALFIAIVVGFWIMHGPARVIERRNSFLVKANYKKYLVDGTMALPMQWHTDHHSGDTIDKIEKGTHGLYEYSEHTFEVIDTIVKLISSYLALVYFNLHSGYIVALMVIITLTIIFRYDNILKKQYTELYRADNRIMAKVFDTISNITTVVILRLEKLSSKAIVQKIMAPFRLYKKNIRINEVKWFIVSLCGAIMMFFVIATYIGSSYIRNETIVIGTLYVLYGYVERIKNIFFRFAWRYGDIVKWKSAVENAEEISNEFEQRRKVKQIKLDTGWKQIGIKNLQFHYGDEEGELHLDDVSLTFNRKEKIALVGESGSGKTTFLKLIRALYKPRNVEIFIDKEKVKGFEAIGPNIVLIPQDPELFTTTIRKNITMGLPYDEKIIKKYTDMARFTQVIKELPNGLESSIVEKGVNLSGGEKQRLALARGLLAAADKPILLLDEPTSSVDPSNELDIYKNIFSIYKNKTIISSVHRLHLLPYFDKIYLFKKGQIVARGSFRQLLKNKEFAYIWRRYTKTQSMH